MHLKENKGQKRKRKKQKHFITISQLNVINTTIDCKGKLNYKHIDYDLVSTKYFAPF